MNRFHSLRLSILLGFALAAMCLPLCGQGEPHRAGPVGGQVSAVTAPHGPAACPFRDQSESQGLEFDLCCDRAATTFAPRLVSGLPLLETGDSRSISLQTLHVRLDL